MQKKYSFTVDDNIYIFKELAEKGYASIFDSPYLRMFRDLHERFNLCVQLNVFFATDGFDLTQMPDTYKAEWQANADWLRLAFHSRAERPSDPYIHADYDEVYRDCKDIEREIIRFAGAEVLAKSVTVHYMEGTKEACAALADCGVKTLVGMFKTPNNPIKCYYFDHDEGARFAQAVAFSDNGMRFTNLDIVLNCQPLAEICPILTPCLGRPLVQMMIHEQYFHTYYRAYQPDYREKIEAAATLLQENGYTSTFLDDYTE